MPSSRTELVPAGPGWGLMAGVCNGSGGVPKERERLRAVNGGEAPAAV